MELADLVGEGLTGPDDVAVDLDLDLVPGADGVGGEELDGPVAAPAQGVQPGVEHQAAGPHHLRVERAVALVGVDVEAELGTEALAVEAPALHERGAGER